MPCDGAWPAEQVRLFRDVDRFREPALEFEQHGLGRAEREAALDPLAVA